MINSPASSSPATSIPPSRSPSFHQSGAAVEGELDVKSSGLANGLLALRMHFKVVGCEIKSFSIL